MIDITTLDFTPALSEGDHYSMANAVAEVELDNGRSAEIYIAADYEYENSLITVIERDEDGCQDRAYDSESMQEWPLLDSFFGSRENWQNFGFEYAEKAKAIAEYDANYSDDDE